MRQDVESPSRSALAVLQTVEFDDMAREYQGIRAPSGDLLRAVKKGRRKLRDGLITGVVLGTLTSVAGGVVLYRDRDAGAVVFAVMQIGFPLLVLAFAAYSQRNAWRAKSDTVRGYLNLQLERCRDQLRKQRFLRWALLPLTGLMAVFHVLLVQAHPALVASPFADHQALRLTSLVVGLGGPYMILAGVLVYSRRKLARVRRKEAVLMHEIAELDDLR